MDFRKDIEKLIKRALEEDLGAVGDITSAALIHEDAVLSGKFVCKERCVLAGLPYLETLFQSIDPDIKVHIKAKEGSKQKAGAIIAVVEGPARGILAAERTALNFLQHASGVATMTSVYVKELKGYSCDILDTRKTLPGLRALEQYAVTVAGGINHRYGLGTRIIIKRNHLSFIAAKSRKPIIEAVKSVKAAYPNIPVEIELIDYAEVLEALKTDLDSIMLDHMIPSQIVKCVKAIRKTPKKVYLEYGGAITPETVEYYAKTGVDGIATSEITYLARPSDIRLRLMV